MNEPKKLRGTAAMDLETRREVARKGGIAASKNRERMAEIGRKGAAAMLKKHGKAHMSRIGKIGGAHCPEKEFECDRCPTKVKRLEILRFQDEDGTKYKLCKPCYHQASA